MQSISSIWSALDAPRRIIVILATIAVFTAVLMMARGASKPDMALLFGGLEPATAGDVLTALDQRGVAYDIRGESIFVPTVQRDSLRLALAGEGLPATGTKGYELLDQMTGFGTTSQMFDAAYLRAKEGELARTILSSPHIRSARVHISAQTGRPFQGQNAATAAVTVTTIDGAMNSAQVKALQYLVAAAVSGLSPDDVAVIDGDGALLSVGQSGIDASATDDRAEMLRQRAERLLAARVGAGNAVVEVSLETVMDTEQIIERKIDPETRVAISTDISENTGKSTDTQGGDVTVASNLPDGDAAGGDGSSNSESSETRSLTNYEVSQVERQISRGPGAVRRLTVAVLVNDAVTIAADGSTTNTPRSDAELADLRDLVASAVGLDEQRGDVITLRSLAFEPLPDLGTFGQTAPASSQLDLMRLIQIGVLAVVALILGLFVVRPIFAGKGAQAALPPPTFDTSGPANMALLPNGAPEIEGQATDVTADPVTRLRKMIEHREAETIQILQGWMEDPEKSESA